jgi:hypothetical protein
MAEDQSFPVGQAPWETAQAAPPADSAGQSFPVGQAPWEQDASSPPSDSSGNAFLDKHPTLRTMVQGAVNDLPLAGTLVGGAVGSAAGGIPGAILGGGTGAAAGTQFRDKLNDWIFGKKTDQKTTEESMAKEGLTASATQGAGELLLGGGKLLAGTKTGQAVLGGAGTVASKVGEAVFRVPAQVIKRYATAAKEIAGMSARADGDIAAASDAVKESYAKSIDGFRTQMGEQISSALKESKKTVTAQPIIEALQKIKADLHPKLQSDQVSQITDMISKVKQLSGEAVEKAPANSKDDLAQFLTKMTGQAEEAGRTTPKGQIPVGEAHQLKQYLQDLAKTAYRNPGESAVGTRAANAAKRGASVARKLINEAVPEVAAANNQLSALHSIEDSMNRSLLREGASETGLVSAGKGANARNARALKKLGDLVGTDFLGKAENLAAMKTFGDASLKKAGLGAVAGGALGYGVDGQNGAMVGAAIGGGVTSPYVLKKGIDAAVRLAPSVDSSLGRQVLGQAVMHGSAAQKQIEENQP